MTFRNLRRVAATIVVTTLAVGTQVGLTAAQPQTSSQRCRPGTTSTAHIKAAHGSAAIALLRARDVPTTQHRPATQLAHELAHDSTMWLNQCGAIFYVDKVAPRASSTPWDRSPAVAPYPLAKTFLLNSRPGSNRTIYLNFTGRVISQTIWNAGSPFSWPNGYKFGPFDEDGDPSTYSPSERAVIQQAWRIVAEDYAPFGVNVTTQDPGFDAIDRSSAQDTVYGTEAAFTTDQSLVPICHCSGIAMVGAFDQSGVHAYGQPAIVISPPGTTITTAGQTGDVASHEIGHTLGLLHHGDATHEYYQAPQDGPWGALMGTTWFNPVSQWSRGEYDGSNNQQDDLAVMAANGATPMPDDVGNSAEHATALPANQKFAGLISKQDDSDWFAFRASGATKIAAKPAPSRPDLNIGLALYDSLGHRIASSNPPVVAKSNVLALGMDASISIKVRAGTYFIEVRGTGDGDARSPYGFSNYASLGTYELTAKSEIAPQNSGALPLATVGQPFSTTLFASADVVSPAWSLSAGILPVGLRLDGSTGTLSGTPTGAGTSAVRIRAAGSNGIVSTRTYAVTVMAPTTSPSAPLDATAQGRADAVEVSWSAPFMSGGGSSESYTVTLQPGGATCTTTALRCTITGLQLQHSYSATVVATSGGVSGPPSPSTAFRTTGPPDPVRKLWAGPLNAALVVGWTRPLFDGGAALQKYVATASPGNHSCSPTYATLLECTITGLINDRKYTVTVTASNRFGVGSPVNASRSYRPMAHLSPPNRVHARALKGAIVTSWTPVDTGGVPVTSYTAVVAPGYQYCRTNGALSCTIRGLTRGTRYWVYVQARTQFMISAMSRPSNIVTPS